MNHPVEFRKFEEADRNMILSDWLKSFRRAQMAYTRDMSNTVYYREHQKVIKRTLDRAQIVCAVNPEDKNHVFGWTCFEVQGPYSILHYLYVKESFRRFGVGSKLFAFIKSRPFIFTHRTESFRRFESGGVYSIYQFLGG